MTSQSCRERNLGWPDGWVIKILMVLVVVIFLGFAGFYVWDNYFRPSPSALDQAIKHMEDLVRAHPGDPELRVGVADVYSANGMYEQAITQYTEALKVTENHKGALFGLGKAHMALGHKDEAISYFKRVVELGKDSEMARLDKQLEAAYYYLGQIYLDSADFGQAVEHLGNAVALNPGDADAIYLLARAYQGEHDYNEAVNQYSQVITFVPDFKEAYQGMSDCYQALNDLGGVAYANGMVALLSGKYSEAIQELEVAVARRADIANAFWGLGTAYERTGQTEQAETAYRQALAVDPDHILAKDSIRRLERMSP